MKKLILLFAILCLSGISIFAQRQSTIELNKEIKVTEDSVKKATKEIMLNLGFKFLALPQKGLLLLNQQSGCLTIYAKDAVSDKLIDGAKFSIRNSSNLLMGEYTATNGVLSITGMKYGTYTFTSLAPPGYENKISVQSVKVDNNVSKELNFVYTRLLPQSMPIVYSQVSGRTFTEEYNAVRIGEYYWVDKNFHHNVLDGDYVEFEPAMVTTKEMINRDMIRARLDTNRYKVDINDFRKYYGAYYSTYSIGHMNNVGKIYDKNNNQIEGWGLPESSDFRQLFGMCPFNVTHDPQHESLNERDVRFALSARTGDNPLAFNFSNSAQSPYRVYWFDNNNVTNKYKFNMMPGGARLNGTSRICNGYGPSNGCYLNQPCGEIYNLFYTAKFAVRGNTFVNLYDYMDTGIEMSYHWFNIRWCRRLTDSELGYKLYVKANSSNWPNVSSQLSSKGEEPLLRELINNRILPQDISIVKAGLNDIPPQGYVELPKGYIRGFYVQYFIDNPNSGKTIADIASYSIKVEDHFVINLKDAPQMKSQLLDGNNSDELTLYPNPVDNILNIKTSKTVKVVMIYNMGGALLINKRNIDENSLDVSKLKAGIYIVKLEAEGKIYSYKIVKK